MIYGLTPDQEKKFKIKAAASQIAEKDRKWIYNDMNQGVLVNTIAECEEIESIFNLSEPNCDNREISVIKFGEAKKQINKAKKDIVKKAEKVNAEKPVKPKEAEKKDKK